MGEGVVRYLMMIDKWYIYLASETIQESLGNLLNAKHYLMFYSILANGVRNHLRAERKEDKRQEMMERQKREKRKSILKEGTQRMIPAELQELGMLSSLENKSLSQILSSASSISSRHGSITGRESLILPPLQESSANSTGNVHYARTFSLPVTSGVSEKTLGKVKPRQKIGGSLSL